MNSLLAKNRTERMTLLLIVVAAIIAATAIYINQTTLAPRDTKYVHEHIFGDARPFQQCHASSLVQVSDDTFLAVWFGGTREGHQDVAIWGAERHRGNWSAPHELSKVSDSPHWNPVLFKAPSGRVHLFFKVGDSPREWQTWTMSSSDGGDTWTEPRELVVGEPLSRGPVKNKPIVLSDGTWLAPASIERKDRWDVFVDRSEDRGLTWESTDLIPLDHSDFEGKGVIQPTLWESKPGHVHMLMRSTCGYVCRSDSTDYGRTWSPINKTDLPNNNSGLDVAKLEDGTLVLVYNPVSGDWAARTPLSIAVSFDNGGTWTHYLDIETGPGEYSYPSVIPTSEGVAITYTWERERIAFWMGPIERE